MYAEKHQIENLAHLTKRADYLCIQKAGEKWFSKGMILQARRTEGSGQQRFGLTASKRLSKSAVVRNRIKRRLRATACDVLPLYAASDADYVLIGRPDTVTRSYEELQNDLKWCLKKLGFEK